MPRTITVDGVQVFSLRLVKGVSGEIQVYAEYHLKSGGQLIQEKHGEISGRLSAQRRAGVLAVFEGIVQDLTAAELA